MGERQYQKETAGEDQTRFFHSSHPIGAVMYAAEEEGNDDEGPHRTCGKETCKEEENIIEGGGVVNKVYLKTAGGK